MMNKEAMRPALFYLQGLLVASLSGVGCRIWGDEYPGLLARTDTRHCVAKARVRLPIVPAGTEQGGRVPLIGEFVVDEGPASWLIAL
jgi:hypothetical protein